MVVISVYKIIKPFLVVFKNFILKNAKVKNLIAFRTYLKNKIQQKAT